MKVLLSGAGGVAVFPWNSQGQGAAVLPEETDASGGTVRVISASSDGSLGLELNRRECRRMSEEQKQRFSRRNCF